ncbi:MAG: alpha/beta hydrolase, partial [Candidatus Spechtbacterales bacterium]
MERSITVGALATHYTEYGGGTPILILHGWGSSADTWQGVQEQLATHGYRAIALDLPGFGATAEPPREWNLSEYTHFVRSFVAQEQLGRFVIVGHSFGGRIAIEYASKYGEGVAAVVLCGAAGIVRPISFKRSFFAMIARGGKILAQAPFLRATYNTTRKVFYKVLGERDYYNASPVM